MATPRRTARSARRRLRRRKQRLNYLKDFFINRDILTVNEIEKILSPHKNAKNPYELREKGINERLDNDELFIALYHIAKRRGYKSNRKSIEDNDKETGRVLRSISDNKQLLVKYKTVAATLNQDSKFIEHKRNKSDDYSNSFIREDFLAEIKEILTTQQKYHKELTDDKIAELLFKNYTLEYDITKKNGKELQADRIMHKKVKMAVGLFAQRPFMDKDLIEQMRGKCPFEKSELRAQKASVTFEVFRLAQNLAHLVVVEGKNKRSLTEEEIKKCIEKCKNTSKVTYKVIRETLGHKNDDNFEFDYIRGKDPSKEDLEKNRFAKEENLFAKLMFYRAVMNALKDLPNDWRTVENDTDLFDEIGYILTVNKDDEVITTDLAKLEKLSEAAITELTRLSFAGFSHLSIKAIKKITPIIIKGSTYDEAIRSVGYVFDAKLSGDKNKLPPLNEEQSDQITNPVVKRAVSQTIKVVNAVISKYGAPSRIGLECAGELAKNFDDRRDIKKAQDENAVENDKLVERLKNEFHVTNPTGLQITKFRLYNEQVAKCPYCVIGLNIDQLFIDEHYGEIDHIIPFSRCGNDGRGNKVLVHNACNQNKRNQTPYETWGTDDNRWEKIESFAKATYFGKTYRKGLRLIAKTLPKEDWNLRAINDTRYISKFMSNFIKQNLKFADNEGKQKVIMPAGGITSYLRRAWHVGTKDRDESNLHHATDAIIVALVDQGVIQSVSNLNKYYELFSRGGEDEVTDRLTGEIVKRSDLERGKEDVMPFGNQDFDKEVRLRTSQIKENENLNIWRDQFRDLYKDQGDFINTITPIFVSRMPKRRGTGKTNKDTIRSLTKEEREVIGSGKKLISPIGDQRTTRKRLYDITLKDLANSALPESDALLYAQLKELLEKASDDPKKAFSETFTDAAGKQKTRPLKIYKGGKSVDKNGNPISPVSTIKVYSTEFSGLLINDGKAFVNNGDIIRTDVYRYIGEGRPKSNIRYKYIPLYAHQLHRPEVLDDDNFEFVFSLYKNDYFVAVFDDKRVEGYFNNYPGKSRLVYTEHNSTQQGNKYIDTGKALAIRKYDINILGDNYKWA